MTIDRHALILKPKQLFADWVNYVFPENPVNLELFNTHDSANIYLIPEIHDTDEAMKWIKKNYRKFFEIELEDWCTDEKMWPEKLSWKMFCDWFEWKYESVIWDMIDAPIQRSEF